MKQRFHYAQQAPAALQGMLALEKACHDFDLEPVIRHLVKLRVSQINGCAYCIDMHWKDLRALGESEERLYMLDAWDESPLYSERERAALTWAEACTNLQDGHVSDAVYEEVSAHFDEKGISELTFVIAAINAWNRLAIPGRAVPGRYKSSLSA